MINYIFFQHLPLSFSAMLNHDFDSFNEISVSTTLQPGSTASSQFGLFHLVSFLLVHSLFLPHPTSCALMAFNAGRESTTAIMRLGDDGEAVEESRQRQREQE